MPACGICKLRPGSCFGVTHDVGGQFACDECCGHAQEDGWCLPIADACQFLYKEFAAMRVEICTREAEEAGVRARRNESEERFLAVYGAMVALQVRDHMREGHGAPTDAAMLDFVEEARAVAGLSEEVHK